MIDGLLFEALWYPNSNDSLWEKVLGMCSSVQEFLNTDRQAQSLNAVESQKCIWFQNFAPTGRIEPIQYPNMKFIDENQVQPNTIEQIMFEIF